VPDESSRQAYSVALGIIYGTLPGGLLGGPGLITGGLLGYRVAAVGLNDYMH
jgi:hypothetical protein